MPLDHLPNLEGQMQREFHRRKHFPYIYYCPGCVRAYLSREKEGACKFCQGPVMILTGGKRYIYFCERCDKRIEEDEPVMACETCGSRIMTLYRWDMLAGKERRRIKMARFFNSLSGRKVPKERKPVEAGIKMENVQIEAVKKKSEGKTGKLKGEELPSY